MLCLHGDTRLRQLPLAPGTNPGARETTKECTSVSVCWTCCASIVCRSRTTTAVLWRSVRDLFANSFSLANSFASFCTETPTTCYPTRCNLRTDEWVVVQRGLRGNAATFDGWISMLSSRPSLSRCCSTPSFMTNLADKRQVLPWNPRPPSMIMKIVANCVCNPGISFSTKRSLNSSTILAYGRKFHVVTSHHDKPAEVVGACWLRPFRS